MKFPQGLSHLEAGSRQASSRLGADSMGDNLDAQIGTESIQLGNMETQMAEQRQVSFSNLEQALQDAESLLAKGYTSAGDWNLSQCCLHLNDWLSFPMDGFPKAPLPMRIIMGVMKVTVGKRQLSQILDEGFKPGLPTQPDTVYEPDARSDADAVATLRATVDRFEKHSGAIHSSPFFGDMDKPTVMGLQIRHFEHHLSFLLPK